MQGATFLMKFNAGRAPAQKEKALLAQALLEYEFVINIISYLEVVSGG